MFTINLRYFKTKIKQTTRILDRIIRSSEPLESFDISFRDKQHRNGFCHISFSTIHKPLSAEITHAWVNRN